MPSWLMTHRGEGSAMPTGGRMQLVEGIEFIDRLPATGARWRIEQRRDERYFRASWFADFRARWQRDLRNARFAGPLNQFASEVK